jgi:hypothetical protein
MQKHDQGNQDNVGIDLLKAPAPTTMAYAKQARRVEPHQAQGETQK